MARQYLKKKILLAGKSDGELFKRTFTIVKKISEGSSVICYESYHETSGRGILKEFYPEDAYSLERNKDGQLVHTEGFEAAEERFAAMEKNYIVPYNELLKIKKNKNNRDLSTFIPAFEIYHGCNKDGEVVGSTYIWTPDPKLETFESICKEIHKHPTKNPEHKLVMVLSAIESLTKCICALHEAELIHRDIKPSNFGFVKRASETLTQTISLFDVNTICSVYDDSEEVVGTPGFMEPESGYLPINNQTDIYSIGATLFYAIIVSDEMREKEYCYSDEMYKSLREYVENSELISTCENNSHPRLKNLLIHILEKSLAKRNYRYDNCEELIEDIEKAIYYLLPSELSKKSMAREQWVLQNIEDLSTKSDLSSLINYHLYKNPLYKYVRENNSSLNVMIVGFGNYGQKILDACLQLGQMPLKKLRVTVLTEELTDRDIYLSERPALKDFFSINCLETDDPTSYGTIIFEEVSTLREEKSDNYKVIKSVIKKNYDDNEVNYFCIALENDELNYKTAKAIGNGLSKTDDKAVVTFIQQKRKKRARYIDMLKPIYICDSLEKDLLYKEIERMAFNAHLIWQRDLNIDFNTVKKNFKKKYNHISCIANVLFMKYKLYGIGIDLDKVSCLEAARIFTESGLINDRQKNNLKDQLVYAEHKRWIVEKLCLGWDKLDKEEACLKGITKDERKKKHVCLVRSEPNQLLTQKFNSNGSFQKWDNATDEELSQLDDLDRLSVDLHRIYCRQADKLKRENVLNGYVISSIRSLVSDDKKLFATFQEWYSCIKELWNGDRSKVVVYESMKESLLKEVDNYHSENKNTIRGQIKLFDSLICPLLNSLRYTDYKQLDLAYIDNIPFMLTYTENINLFIPYSDGNNTALFSNLAAAILVNPKKLIYLCYIEHKLDIVNIKNNLNYLLGFMNKKNMRAFIDFVFICNSKNSDYITKDDELEIKENCKNRIRNIKIIWIDKVVEISDKLIDYFNGQKKYGKILAVEKNDSKISYLLFGADLYSKVPSYEFDLNTMSFVDVNGCQELAYINKNPHISVADMMSISLSTSDSCNQPEFYMDYKKLWARYRKKTSTWKMLCRLLKNYANTNDIITKLVLTKDKCEEQELKYYLPYTCFETVKKIISFLKENGAIESESMVSMYTTSSLEVIIKDKMGNKEKYDCIFSNVYKLMGENDLTMFYNDRSHEVLFVFDDLMVSCLDIPANNELVQLFDFFSENGYLINTTIYQNKISFTYATRRIKELFTTEGKMLEIYVYHKLKELGKFDDVVSSFEIDWENTALKNEFDCIVTKGFRTIFIECKARTELEQDFYYKLSSLAEHFGINSTVVLVADTEEKKDTEVSKKNSIQRQRGNMMNVITIWKNEEISNIGHTLLKIINGKYVDA